MSPAEFILGMNAILCAVLGGAALGSKNRTWAHWLFFGGMLGLGLETALWWSTLYPAEPAVRLRVQEWRVVVSAWLPVLWVGFSLSYSRGNAIEFLKRWQLGLAGMLALAVTVTAGFLKGGLLQWGEQAIDSGYTVMVFKDLARLANLIELVASILVLTNLERTFRSSVGTMRWRIKYMVVGLLVLFGGRVYVSTQFLLYNAVSLGLELVGAVTLLTACLLMGFSLTRARFANLDVYPSHAVLRNSVTGVIAGVYLLVVGVLAKIVSALGGGALFPLVTLTIIIGGVGVSLLFLSDRIRQQVKRFVSRNFRRPFHDYRRVWSSFTERTAATTSEGDFGREVAKLVAETFEVLSVSIWLMEEDRREFRCVASTAAGEAGGSTEMEPEEISADAVSALQRLKYPLHLESHPGGEIQQFGRLVPEQFRKGGGRVCVPLTTGEALLGVVMLGDRVSGANFSVDDFDLLKCIGDHVAARLRNLRLSARLLQAKEMEAFQTMSAFFVHDLKNTASTLSLMLQNMAKHFDDPSFREDAMRGLGRSVEHISRLVTELGVLRQKLEPRFQELDVDGLVREQVGRLEWSGGVSLVLEDGGAGRVVADAEMLQKVLVNLLINAREAVVDHGEVRVGTGRGAGWVRVEVQDNGAGMTAEFLRHSLFKPFRTTKKKGLGIGMFHCRMMVEAMGGRIEVESAVGKGTLVRVLLPEQR